MDKLQGKRKSELAIAASPTKKVEPTLDKKVWNPLNLDLNAGTQSIAQPKAKQLETRSFPSVLSNGGEFVCKDRHGQG